MSTLKYSIVISEDQICRRLDQTKTIKIVEVVTGQ